jgi:predicted nucleic acid binding AN1-type Zn finger protein
MSRKLLWTETCPAQMKLEEPFRTKNDLHVVMKKQYSTHLSPFIEFHGFTISQLEKHTKVTASKVGVQRKYII